MSLVLRQVKGSKLTIAEGDGNFTYLQNLANKYKGSVSSFFDITGGATTNFSSTGSWQPLISNSQAGLSYNGFMLLLPDLFATGNFGFEYGVPSINPTPAIFKFEVILSITGSNGKNIEVALFKDAGNTGNPTIWPCSLQETTTNTPGSRPVQLITQCVINLVQGDTASLFVRNMSDTSSITINSMNVIWTRYLI
jgi:hypothetical protein